MSLATGAVGNLSGLRHIYETKQNICEITSGIIEPLLAWLLSQLSLYNNVSITPLCPCVFFDV